MQVCVEVPHPEDSGMVWRKQKAGKSWEAFNVFPDLSGMDGGKTG